ncbi:hypothetical protein [Actibacterium sp. 188UL27-1]|nr:hypothetical protein [Actibacterium sp. 188UL27-1]MBM7068789.1 hypothetical protein [Actibacterium sp. 188UL27-1]
MADKPRDTAAQTRDTRLKQALKANLQKRKAQAKARSEEDRPSDTGDRE